MRVFSGNTFQSRKTGGKTYFSRRGDLYVKFVDLETYVKCIFTHCQQYNLTFDP